MNEFTFIIPVYNVEAYLSECVQSILHQTYERYRIILVDDGSTDNSGRLCDELAVTNDRITVIHKTNGGLSSARNAGLRDSATEYVIFLDSDDYWCNENALAEIDALLELRPVDIVAFSSKNLYQDTGRIVDDRYDYPESLNGLTSVECIRQMVATDRLNLSAAKKCYRRLFLVDNNLYFVEGIKSEDVEQGIRSLTYLPTFSFLNKKLYVYRHRSNSISTTIDRGHIADYIRIVEQAADRSYPDEIRSSILSYVAYQYALLLAHITSLGDESYKDEIRYLRKYRYLFTYTDYPRTRFIGILHKVMGYTLTRKVLCAYLKRKP